MERLQGTTAVVTGAASGIGLGITRALIAEGVNVAMLDIRQSALEEAAASLDRGQVKLRGFVVDVTDRERMSETAKDVQSHFGDIQILCNNAGVASGGAINDLSYADWDWCIGINLMGVINGIQSYLPLLTSHGQGGHIVNTSSILGMATMPGQAVYATSKYAVVGLSEAARRDLAPKNIGVSVLCPGLIATNIIKSLDKHLNETGTQEASDVLANIHETYQEKGLSADVVGEQVVLGLKENKPYIFTQSGLVSIVEQRFQEVLAGFDGSEAQESGTLSLND